MDNFSSIPHDHPFRLGLSSGPVHAEFFGGKIQLSTLFPWGKLAEIQSECLDDLQGLIYRKAALSVKFSIRLSRAATCGKRELYDHRSHPRWSPSSARTPAVRFCRSRLAQSAPLIAQLRNWSIFRRATPIKVQWRLARIDYHPRRILAERSLRDVKIATMMRTEPALGCVD